MCLTLGHGVESRKSTLEGELVKKIMFQAMKTLKRLKGVTRGGGSPPQIEGLN